MTRNQEINPEVRVGIIMGSASDLPIMKVTGDILDKFGIQHEMGIKSAHRTPERMAEYGRTALGRGLKVIIAGAGGSAHLQGMTAAFAPRIHVLGVAAGNKPQSIDAAIWSEIAMPGGVSLPFMGFGEAGAKNAGLETVKILAHTDPPLWDKLDQYHDAQRDAVIADDEMLHRLGAAQYLSQTDMTGITG